MTRRPAEAGQKAQGRRSQRVSAWRLGAACNKLHTFCMWMDAESEEKGHDNDYSGEWDEAEHDPAWSLGADRVYWRRRFFILCAGVVALGVCAWLFPGTRQPSKPDVAAMNASMAALAKRQALPAAATGPAWPRVSSMPNVYPAVPAKPAKPAKAAKPTKAAKPVQKASTARHRKPAPSASPSPSAAKAGTCAPSDIVLSLFTSQPSYAKGAYPKFSVYAVSTSATPCTLSYGAGSVQVVVTRGGHVVWNSAACKPAPAKPVQFALGVPQVLAVAWNPTVTRPAGCAGTLPAGTSATLDAVAMSHGKSSPVRTFKVSQFSR